MNNGVSHILLSRVADLPFIDLYGGLVSIQEETNTVKDGITGLAKSITKRFPVSCDVIDFGKCPAEPGKLVPFIPDSKRKGVLYFEDLGIEPTGASAYGHTFKSTVRLVFWINTQFIDQNPCYEVTMPVVANIISRFSGNPFNQNNFQRISVVPLRIPRSGKELFAAYTYDQAYTQYLMPPFEYGAIDFAVSYTINPSCVGQIQLKDPEQC